MIIVMHGHHNILLSVVESMESRLLEIDTDKPEEERPLRRRLIQEVPQDRLPSEILRTALSWRETQIVWREAWQKAEIGLREAEIPWREADIAWWKAIRAWGIALSYHRTELEALHAELCVPDCPWDGETIFPE